MKLHTYTPEIFKIAEANNVDFLVAKDMFLANIRNAGYDNLPHYPGADEVDYGALKPEHDSLADSAIDWDAKVDEHYDDLTDLFQESRYDEMLERMGNGE